MSLLLGPRRMSVDRDGAGRGARSENVGWPTGSKCVFVSLLYRQTHSNISRISWWGLCRECCFIAASTESIDSVIWTFDHSVWKMLCLWAKRYRRSLWRVTACPPLDEALRCPLILYPSWARILTLIPPILYTLKVRLYQMYLFVGATL